MIKRILALLHARNLEFIRDRSSLGWAIAFPVLLVFGMGMIFSGEEKPLFKVAIIQDSNQTSVTHPFLETRFIEFFDVDELESNIKKVTRHQIDLLLDLKNQPARYWINSSSPNGYIMERLLLSSNDAALQRVTVTGQQVRYVDWLIPGILGMNMMFSCLFGVGYVIVRYRKNGYLKRLSATPTSALEFLTAQIGSRLLLTLSVTVFIYLGTRYFIGFPMNGHYLNLILIAFLGTFSMTAMGLMIAARVANEELAGGLLNIVTWPMMLLSGVWFSLEGSPQYIKTFAQFLPLTHLVDGARSIMIDGSGFIDIAYHVTVLLIMSMLFLAIGASLFKWSQD